MFSYILAIIILVAVSTAVCIGFWLIKSAKSEIDDYMKMAYNYDKNNRLHKVGENLNV